jgi:ketosteroid isomerase-like protein
VPSAVREYFTAIDDGDAERAARCFTNDAVVATPPLDDETGDRVVRRGRSQLLDTFRHRGRPAWRHELTRARTNEDVVLVEGELRPLDADDALAAFVLVVTIDLATGLISEFRSYRRAGQADGAPVEAVQPWMGLLSQAVAVDHRSTASITFHPSASLSVPARTPVRGTPSVDDVETVFSSADAVAITGRSTGVEFVLLAQYGGRPGLVDSFAVHWCTVGENEDKTR